MYYKCISCGHVFESGEEDVVEDNVFWIKGARYVEKRSVCPVCGGDFEEACACKGCGEKHLEDELVNGYCQECVDLAIFKFRRDPIGCFSIAKKAKETEAVNINLFLASMFSADEIEQILLRELVQSSILMPVDCTPFIESDKSWFVEVITNEGVVK